jgi:hypothetical protein
VGKRQEPVRLPIRHIAETFREPVESVRVNVNVSVNVNVRCRHTRASLVLTAITVVTACQPRTSQPAAVARCTITSDAPQASISFAIPQNVLAGNAPVPRSSSERLVFGQLYQTLVGVDCTGTILPMLAQRWEASADRSVWRFRIREGARFWDGSLVTARDVAESWAIRSDSVLPIAGINVLGERELQVTLRGPISGAERFADQALAVARHVPGGWPLGTGSYRPAPGGDARSLEIVAIGATAGPSAIRFRTMGDARAALDAGVIALTTADPAAIDYARALRGYTVTPIGWNRTYVLGTHRMLLADSASAAVPAAAGTSLQEAVRAETRAAEAPFWWQKAECGPIAFLPPRTNLRNRNIVYPSSDAIARGIAERLVALAWPLARAPDWLRAQLGDYSALGPLAAVGVDQRTLLETLRGGRALAVVTSLPRPVRALCISTNDAAAAALLSGWRVSPLLDARDYLVQRGTLGRVLLDGSGNISFAPGAL